MIFCFKLKKRISGILTKYLVCVCENKLTMNITYLINIYYNE